MGLTLGSYKSLIVKLLPQGQAWRGDNLISLVQSFACEAQRMAAKIEQIFAEANPAATDECLADWESVCGLPKQNFDLASTKELRRADVLAQLVSTGGQNAAYYVQIAKSLGYAIEISDAFRPFRVGDRVGNSLYSVSWMYVFQVNVTNSSVSDEKLEYLINLYKPAHTVALFTWKDS